MAPARILMVDDDATVRRLAVTVLSMAGYDVAEVANAEAGAALVAQQLPDIVLMDRTLPGMDGWTFTRMLKADTRTRNVTVLACSGTATRQADAEAVQAGCDGFIAKPFDVGTLLRTVAWYAALRESRLGPRPSLFFTLDATPYRRPLGAVQRRTTHVLPLLAGAERSVHPISETL